MAHDDGGSQAPEGGGRGPGEGPGADEGRIPDGGDRAPKSRTLGVRVTEREWRAANRLADRKGTSVDALLRKWGVERILEVEREAEAGSDAR